MLTSMTLLPFFLAFNLFLSPLSSYFSKETHFTPKSLGIRAHFLSHNISTSHIEGLAITFTPRLSIPFPLVIRTFMERLPHTWHMVIFTYNESMTDKRDLLNHILIGTVMPSRAHLLTLPLSFSVHIYSCVVLSREFYQDIPTPWVLLFQMDSLLLRRDDQHRDRSPNRLLYLRDFFSYPYLGAPWNFRHCSERGGDPCRDGGNGGFTLRSRDFMINVTSHNMFEVKRHRSGGCESEDQAFSNFMQKVRREKGKVREDNRAHSLFPFSFSHFTLIKRTLFPPSLSLKHTLSTTSPRSLQRASFFNSQWRLSSRATHWECTSLGCTFRM